MSLLISTIVGIIGFGSLVWYYAALGKRIHQEEKEAGRDLSYEINPITGSAKDISNQDKK
ncbi:hypothetical protein V7056_05745 [Bacillus sp. JJ664]